MNKIIGRKLANGKRRIERRLDKTVMPDLERPVFTASNVHYEIADRVHGLAHGGIGAFHLLARRIGLIDAVDRRLHLLKIHLPYHESDHVLNLAYNALCDGTCLQDLELRRNDEVYLNALGADRIPDPTTAMARGDEFFIPSPAMGRGVCRPRLYAGMVNPDHFGSCG